MNFFSQFLPQELKQGYWNPFFESFVDILDELIQSFCMRYPDLTEVELARQGILLLFPELVLNEDTVEYPLTKSLTDCLLVSSWFIERGYADVLGIWVKVEDHWELGFRRKPFLGESLDPRSLTLDLFKQYYWEAYGLNLKYEENPAQLGEYFFRRLVANYRTVVGLTAAIKGIQLFLWATGADAVIYRVYCSPSNQYTNWEEWVLCDHRDAYKAETLEALGYVEIPALAIALDVLSSKTVSVEELKTVLLERILPANVSLLWVVNGALSLDGVSLVMEKQEHQDIPTLAAIVPVYATHIARRLYDVSLDGVEVQPYQLRRLNGDLVERYDFWEILE